MRITVQVTLWMLLTGLAITRDALAHGGGMDRSHDEEEASSTEPLQPYDDPFDVWPLNLVGHWNETPENVQASQDAIRQELESVNRVSTPREKLVELEEKMRQLDVRSSIARKRVERDTMRKDGRRSQAEELDREIHELKSQLAVLEQGSRS